MHAGFFPLKGSFTQWNVITFLRTNWTKNMNEKRRWKRILHNVVLDHHTHTMHPANYSEHSFISSWAFLSITISRSCEFYEKFCSNFIMFVRNDNDDVVVVVVVDRRRINNLMEFIACILVCKRVDGSFSFPSWCLSLFHHSLPIIQFLRKRLQREKQMEQSEIEHCGKQEQTTRHIEACVSYILFSALEWREKEWSEHRMEKILWPKHVEKAVQVQSGYVCESAIIFHQKIFIFIHLLWLLLLLLIRGQY